MARAYTGSEIVAKVLQATKLIEKGTPLKAVWNKAKITRQTYKGGFSEVRDCEVTTEVTSDPEKVRISGPVSPADLIQLLDSCPLPDLVMHTIKTLIQPYVCSPKSPGRGCAEQICKK